LWNRVATYWLDAAMRWNATDGKDHEALRRLAVVLLTLAAIAGGLKRRSAPVRCIVLWRLCRAEVRARDFAIKAGATPELIYAGSPAWLLGGSGEAERLVQKFRALAEGFFALARQAPQRLRIVQRHDPIYLPANRSKLVRPRLDPGKRQLSFTDTS
jgi:hypothetical protein